MLSRCLIIDVNLVLEKLLHIYVGNVACFSEVHATYIFVVCPEDGSSMYVGNIGNTAHIDTV
jgi:hypothetical protein